MAVPDTPPARPYLEERMSLKDPKKYRKYMREYYHKNLEKLRASRRKSTKKYRLKYPERSKASTAAYKRKNAARINAINNTWRTRKTQAGGSFTAEEWKLLCKKYNYKCLCCGKRKKLTADHVIPVSKGGSSNITNIQPLCQSCNSKKRAGTTDFRLQY
jgi:5-methylcytosine-specific restriction endonuclease McrA